MVERPCIAADQEVNISLDLIEEDNGKRSMVNEQYVFGNDETRFGFVKDGWDSERLKDVTSHADRYRSQFQTTLHLWRFAFGLAGTRASDGGSLAD